MSQKPTEVIMDLEDRDPNTLSQHLQVVWADIVGEPESFRSPECAWRVSSQCFNLSKNCCYIFLSVFIAPIAALCIGCSFACLAFKHIWCWTPGLRCCKISCSVTRSYVRAVCEAVIIPVCESLGYCLSSMKIRKQNIPDGPDHRDDILLL